MNNKSAESGAAATRDDIHLLRNFSIFGGVAIVLAAITFSWTYYRNVVDSQIESTEARNVMLAQTFANSIWLHFEPYLLRKFTDANQLRQDPNTQKLQDMLSPMMQHVPVLKVKIFDRSGIAIYSSAQNEIGEDDSANPALQMARTGKTVSEFRLRGESSRFEPEIKNADVVGTYIPIMRGHNDVLAVFELYSDVTDTMSRIRQTTLRLGVGLVSIFVTLYAILLVFVAAADKALRRQSMDREANAGQMLAKNQELEHEVTTRRTVEVALRTSEAAAASANRAKTEFLSNVSHELRTPMNGILGFAQLLVSEPTPPLGVHQRLFVGEILKSGRHLLALINDMLDLARIEAGKLILTVEPVSINSVVEDCLPLIRNMARDMKVRVDAPPAGAGLHIMAEELRLKQVLINLLSNAVKYNREGGRVAISVGSGALNRARISVSDTGIGIPEAMQGEMFRPFQRLVSNTSIVEGTGIGLALSRNLVIAMGGEIGFESVEGTGTTFWVEFALAPGAGPAAEVVVSKKPETNDEYTARGSMLYIEDNPANVFLMEHIARRMSIHCITAHNAELGIILATSQKPDLIVMDLNLPQMSGYDALAQLKLNPATATIPVIALSANAMKDDIARGLAAGFLCYHTKPIDVEEITGTIASILGGRE